MSGTNPIVLLINGLTLALALGFLLIVLWYDVRKAVNQFFAAFLILVILWNIGALLQQVSELVGPDIQLSGLAFALREVGFTGSSVAIYSLTTILVGVHSRRFRLLAFLSMVIVVAYNVFLIVNTIINNIEIQGSIASLFYIFYDGLTLYLLWRYRRKLNSRGLFVGIFIFLLGQSIGFLNPDLGIVNLSTSVSAIGSLIISFSLLQRETITPVVERASQIEAVYKVSVAISSQLSTDTVLDDITWQAVKLLNGDASCIFLVQGKVLELVTVNALPTDYLQTHLEMGQGVVGKVASTRESVYLEHYGRDWKGTPDLPLAMETFGSVICVPLVYAQSVIGVLLVIASPQRHLFSRDDVYLLELLGAQAAIAIANGRLFEDQRKLAEELESAHGQLETVLVSTESPVVAVDRRLRIIFANPAAEKLLHLKPGDPDDTITQLIPRNILPKNYRIVLKTLREKQGYAYEVSVGERVFLCHVASLGEARVQGWVAVLNDITQLKELDRFKSEMVRMTSHDLKNPLQAAMINFDLLKEDLADLDNDEVDVSLDAIEKQLFKMSRIIRGILDLERVRTGTFDSELCIPSKLIDSAVNEVSDQAKDNDIALVVEVEDNLPEFMGNFDQFERALINLLENAIKFTPSGGRVAIVATTKGTNIQFEVSDDGVGIPAALHDKIFDRFFRGRQKSVDHVTGSGLGLSLVKAVVENHKGKVWVESDEDKGSRFFVLVPSLSNS